MKSEVKVIFTDEAWENYLFWQENDRKILKKINLLIKEISREPFKGKGKPEPLKYQLKGFWSRRINAEHRLIYSYIEGEILIISCRFHY